MRSVLRAFVLVILFALAFTALHRRPPRNTHPWGSLAAQQLSTYPTFASASFLGGSGQDEIDGIAVDSTGNIFLVGTTSSPNLPVTANAVQKTAPGGFTDCFVAKLNPSATAFLYLTYLGGSDADNAGAIAVDLDGNAYVVGTTVSRDFPVTTGAAQTRFGGAGVFGDAFVVKLDPSGSQLLYSTYLGGSRDDLAGAVVIDATGAAYLAGSTRSRDFPVTAAAFQPAYGGDPGNISGSGGDGFVAKLNASGSQFEFVTYLGGSAEDRVFSITLDASGNPIVSGTTSSPDFHVTSGVVQSTYAGNGGDPSLSGDAFVTKLDAQGADRIFSTLLGGSGPDGASTIECDSNGNLYVQGFTGSSDFPTFHPLQASAGGKGDAFLAKLNPNATTLVYSTYFGGSGEDSGTGTIDAQGNVYLSGYTYSTDFPILNAFQPFLGEADTYVAKVSASGATLIYASYLGGGAADFGGAIARAPAGYVWLGGTTFSQNFPVRNAYQSAWGGGDTDAFLARITESTASPPESNADLAVSVTSDQDVVGNGSEVHFAVTVANQGPAGAEDVRVTLSLPTPLTFKSAVPAQGSCTPGANVTCSLGALAGSQTVGITIAATVPSKTGQLGGSLSVTAGVLSSTNDPNVANNSAQVNLTLSTPGNVGGSGGSGCFIATAAYGSYLDPHVQVLREFRDRRLLSNIAGRCFARIYYRYSPPAAALIARSEFSRRSVRCLLAPIIFAIGFPYRAAIIFLFAALTAALFRMRKPGRAA